MVQANIPLRVWGTADPGEAIRVFFAGTQDATITGADGEWMVTLPAPKAGARGTLTISGNAVIECKDVAAGEVWFCSGQSNMQMAVKAAANAREEIQGANHPDIRQLFIPLSPSPSPRPAESLKPTGWKQALPANAGDFTAAGFYFAREIQRELKVPVGLVFAAWGGTAIQPWIPLDALACDPDFPKIIERKQAEIAAWPQRKAELDAQIREWQARVDAAKAKGEAAPARPWQPGPPDAGQNMYGQLYNGMVEPAIRFGIRGFLWYQGEANAGGGRSGAETYTRLQNTLIRSWRGKWGLGEMPFLFVQLPNWSNPGDATRESWAWFRLGQQESLATPNTGMAVTIDIGDADDIHPKNKQEVGRRLALIALDRVYQKSGVASRAPSPSGVERSAGALKIVFPPDSGTLAIRDAAPGAFEVTYADGATAPARAALDGRHIVLTGIDAARASRVRYAWGNNPSATLFGSQGLPVAPFVLEIPPATPR